MMNEVEKRSIRKAEVHQYRTVSRKACMGQKTRVKDKFSLPKMDWVRSPSHEKDMYDDKKTSAKSYNICTSLGA